MPRPILPPTPASSTDLKAQDGAKQLAALQLSFELPPPAMTSHEHPQQPSSSEPNRVSPTATTGGAAPQQTPPETPYPVQPSETVKSRRRSSANQPPKSQFSLPPPPTRSRKIIQVKPRSPDEHRGSGPGSGPGPSSGGGAKGAGGAARSSAHAGSQQQATTATAATPAAAGGSKKKQPSATSAAGRKIARKTAHSLIERRRRSKMNEEFAVLKGMVPACTGEMHKLAILQASIEYLRYLEDCVARLKARQDVDPESQPVELSQPPRPDREQFHAEPRSQSFTGGNSPDVDMTGSEERSPTWTGSHPRSQQPSVSPALIGRDSGLNYNSRPSVSTDQRHYSFSASGDVSPALGPQAYHYAHSTHSASGSTLTSPALAPQRDIDQEATAALLMLNQIDRRGINRTPSGRGMSVRDLLTT